MAKKSLRIAQYEPVLAKELGLKIAIVLWYIKFRLNKAKNFLDGPWFSRKLSDFANDIGFDVRTTSRVISTLLKR